MKKIILNLILYISKIGMNFIYFFLKLLPIKQNKITLLSRQSNKINIDFAMLLEEFNKQSEDKQIVVLCKKIPQGLKNKIFYCFYTIKCLYHIATSRVCIIDGYSIPISCLKHKKKLIIIQIWHALGAIKKFGHQVLDKKEGSNSSTAKIMKMHSNYTYVMCASNETKKIYSQAFKTDENKILTLGMPRIDYILNKNNQIENKTKELLEQYPNLKEKQNILYVPTFRKYENTNVDQLIKQVDTEKYNLIIRLHPLDKTQIEEKYKIGKEYKTVELLKIADYVITDYSAIAFEASILEKQLYFYLYDINEYTENRGLNINLEKELPSATHTNIKDIIQKIENNTYNFEELTEFKNKYVETADINNTKRIVDFIFQKMKE